MSESATLTVRLSAKTKDELGTLAELTHRTRSFLAGEAITAFVKRELDIVAGVERGRADLRMGRVIDHDAAMDELDAMVEAIALARK